MGKTNNPLPPMPQPNEYGTVPIYHGDYRKDPYNYRVEYVSTEEYQRRAKGGSAESSNSQGSEASTTLYLGNGNVYDPRTGTVHSSSGDVIQTQSYSRTQQELSEWDEHEERLKELEKKTKSEAEVAEAKARSKAWMDLVNKHQL